MKLWASLVIALCALPANAQVERGQPLVRKAAMGVQLAALTDEEAKSPVLQGGSAIKVTRVLPGLTAEAIKLKDGDWIAKLNGIAADSVATVVSALREFRSGQRVELEIIRDSKRMRLSGRMRARPMQVETGLKVIYDQVVSKGKRIRVIVTHPNSKGPFPAVFLIGGIGAYSIDGNFDSIPYGTVLGPISRKYATIRIDKPGQGDSDGPPYTELLFDDEQDAYVQALRLAKTISSINKDKIAIFGHSMGGAFGPLVAGQEPVAGVSVCGTMTKTWVEYMLENSRRQGVLSGTRASELDAEMKDLSSVSHYLFNEGLSPQQIATQHPELKDAVGGLIPDGKTFSGVGIPFFQQLANKNLMAAWDKVDVPVQAMWGEFDFISTRWDHEYLVESINLRRKGQAEFALLPRSDHGFFDTSSFKDSMTRWGQPGSRFNPVVIGILESWLKRTIGE